MSTPSKKSQLQPTINNWLTAICSQREKASHTFQTHELFERFPQPDNQVVGISTFSRALVKVVVSRNDIETSCKRNGNVRIRQYYFIDPSKTPNEVPNDTIGVPPVAVTPIRNSRKRTRHPVQYPLNPLTLLSRAAESLDQVLIQPIPHTITTPTQINHTNITTQPICHTTIPTPPTINHHLTTTPNEPINDILPLL